MSKFEGAFTALITPFNKDSSIDKEALRELVEFQIEEGISGLVPVGTTGESPTLSHKEHIEVIRIVVDQVKERVPVIAGTGSNATEEAIKLTKSAKDVGATASLQVAPYYNKPTQQGIYQHFAAIAEKTDFPLIIYNIQGRTGQNITTLTMGQLAELEQVVGVKEASGSIPQVMDVIAKTHGIDVLSGDDNLALPITLLGGTGVISVASNFIPKKVTKLIAYARAGKVEEARKLHYALLPFFKAIFIETNPIPIKRALALAGKAEEVYRLPLCAMSDEHAIQYDVIVYQLLNEK